MSDAIHAFVHSGGGSNGAWGVGVEQHLIGNLVVKPVFYVGTSAGGLNGALLCQFPVGEEAAGLTCTMETWAEVEPDLIFKHWKPGGKIGDMRGATCKHSVYDTAPLHEFIADHLDVEKLRASGRPLYVSVVDMASGELLYIDQDHPEILAAIQGTSSYPFFFPPVKFDGRLVSDGGLREITPLQKAVELGATMIDVICCQPATAGEFDPFGKRTLEIAPRLLEIMSAEINKNDLAYDPKEGPEITVRLWQPSKSLGDGLDFSQEKAQRLREEGFEYAHGQGDLGTRIWTIGGLSEGEV